MSEKQEVTGVAPSSRGRSAALRAEPAAQSQAKPAAANAECDTADYRHSFYGILNADGNFWTPLIFDNPECAREHIATFWEFDQRKREECLRTFRIVPVRAHIAALPDPPESAS